MKSIVCGKLVIEHWVSAHGICDGCGGLAEVRVGTVDEWLVAFCLGCTDGMGKAMTVMATAVRYGVTGE